MSEIKVNTLGYHESDIVENWAASFAKAMLEAHINGTVLNHPDGSVTKEKLQGEIYDMLDNAQKDSAYAREIASGVWDKINDMEVGIDEAKSRIESVSVATNGLASQIENVEQELERVSDEGESAIEIAQMANTKADTADEKAYIAQTTANSNSEKISNLNSRFSKSVMKFNVYRMGASQRFYISPGMICLVIPSNGNTLQIYDKNHSQIIDGNVGATIVFSADLNTGEDANGTNNRIGFLYQSSNSLSPLSSYQDLLDYGTYIKNTDSGYAYAIVLVREVDE